MIKDVMITVESKKEDEEGEIEVVSFVTEGTLLCDNLQYEIRYSESEMTGMEGTVTTLKVEDGSVLLIREGTLSSMLVFEKGKTHVSSYDTEFGSLQVGVTARKVDVQMTESGGTIQIDFNLDYNGAQGGRNAINVGVKMKKGMQ